MMDPGAWFGAFYTYANGWVAVAANTVTALPVPYAFGAGILATVNPCGFVMLPAFAAFYTTLGEAAGTRAWRRAARALWLGVLVTATFIAVFGAIGLLISLGGHAVMRATPWAGLIVGIILAAFGFYQLVTRKAVFASATSGVRVQRAQSTRGVVLFGVAYAVCSLGCTLPVFLVVAGSVFLGDRDVAQSLGRFVQFALGMGAVLTVVALGAALSRERMSRWARRVMPAIEGAANVFLVLVGLYIIWYWTAKGGVL